MRVYLSLDQVDVAPVPGRAVSIGVFDGVHKGHQRILSRCVEHARITGAVATAVTFDPHPDAVLHPRSAPRALTSLARKADLLEALGIEELVAVRFDREFAALAPESFCRLVLSARLAARIVFIGENFRFGHGGAGTAADLRDYGLAHGFTVTSVTLVEDGGEVISSTRVRDALRGGRVKEAARLLGRPHQIEGAVVRGAARGRVLEAPTANLALEQGLALPRVGVYVTRSTVDRGNAYASVTSVGTNPTFESDGKLRIETLLLDYTGDLYGSHLAVEFLDRIRSQRRFADAKSLAERIREDVEVARHAHDVLLSDLSDTHGS